MHVITVLSDNKAWKKNKKSEDQAQTLVLSILR